jgi:hypothetical protein
MKGKRTLPKDVVQVTSTITLTPQPSQQPTITQQQQQPIGASKMADKASRYNVTLTVQCKVESLDATGKVASPFADTNAEIKYSGMNYLQIVVTQDLVARFGKMIAETGYAAASASGFAAEVEALLKAAAQTQK